MTDHRPRRRPTIEDVARASGVSRGTVSRVLNNPASGEAARKLYDDAQQMLDTLIKEKWLTANGVIGFFPANAVGDDVEVYTDESRSEVLTTLHNLRQQGK